MKREKISEAMGNISSRHIKEAAEFKAEEKPHRSKTPWVKWASLAACFCLIIVAAFAVIPMLNNGDGNEIIDNVLPTDIDKIIWSNSLGSDSDSEDGYMEWNGFSVDASLYDALQNHSNEYIAVIVTKANGTKIEESECNSILDDLINRDYKNGNLYIFITKDQFANWKIEDKENYIFLLASQSNYEK